MTATQKPRHHGHDGGATPRAAPRDVTATSRRPCPGTPRHPGHDGHATARPQPRHGHDGHDGHGHDRIRGTCPRDTTRHAKTQSHKRSNVAPCNKHPVGECPPGAKSKAAGSLVLTLNARWNIFGLPVTYEVFTYLVVATVSAPYILCIMFLGLMLMVVERSSGPHRYLAAITHCA